MSMNPSKGAVKLDSPIERKNPLNDPKFESQTGYYPYDLTHVEIITPRFGEYVPSFHLDTIPGDRHVLGDDSKTILNRIDGNLLNKVNEYRDYIFTPLRCIYPNNYSKLIPNPPKGDDLPNSALPMIPFAQWVHWMLQSVEEIDMTDGNAYESVRLEEAVNNFRTYASEYDTDIANSFYADLALWRMVSVATMLSRGQLLDYLGVQFDTIATLNDLSHTASHFQYLIDNFFQQLWLSVQNGRGQGYYINPAVNLIHYDIDDESGVGISSLTIDLDELSKFRLFISDALEKGQFFRFIISGSFTADFIRSFEDLKDAILELFPVTSVDNYNPRSIDNLASPFENGDYLNIGKCIAYQMSIAQFGTNDLVDNIFNAELWMQNIRSVLYPSDSAGFSREPTFDYNGVTTEYDYFTTAGWYYGTMAGSGSPIVKSYIALTLIFLLRRSLRYGDKYSTSRTRMLAVGNLSVSVDPTSMQVSVVDLTTNILCQRYFHAVNYTGNEFPNFFASFFGVIPSDLPCQPRFIGHRKQVLNNQVTNNTADNQGAQTTNLLGLTDEQGFDVFIDDFGVILSFHSYDVMPIYTSGIDPSTQLADRFDMFNPMLQNIGDEPIKLSEFFGYPLYNKNVFGYHMRHSAYKFKTSRAHGAAVNDLKGFIMRYPLYFISERDGTTINPDFIRDKPYYFDQLASMLSGASPANYCHFVCSVTNVTHSARRMQPQPSVLF